MTTQHAFYFGCLHWRGHCLYAGDHRIPPSTIPGFPWDTRRLDTGLLDNRGVPDRPDGRVHWTAGGKPLWFAFFWWDRSFDSRPNSHSGFYVQGFTHEQVKEAFEFACAAWPEVVERQQHPLVLVDPEAPRPVTDGRSDAEVLQELVRSLPACQVMIDNGRFCLSPATCGSMSHAPDRCDEHRSLAARPERLVDCDWADELREAIRRRYP